MNAVHGRVFRIGPQGLADRDGGNRATLPLPLAWAHVVADVQRRIDMATADPVLGSCDDPDAPGLTW